MDFSAFLGLTFVLPEIIKFDSNRGSKTQKSSLEASQDFKVPLSIFLQNQIVLFFTQPLVRNSSRLAQQEKIHEKLHRERILTENIRQAKGPYQQNESNSDVNIWATSKILSKITAKLFGRNRLVKKHNGMFLKGQITNNKTNGPITHFIFV